MAGAERAMSRVVMTGAARRVVSGAGSGTGTAAGSCQQRSASLEACRSMQRARPGTQVPCSHAPGRRCCEVGMRPVSAAAETAGSLCHHLPLAVLTAAVPLRRPSRTSSCTGARQMLFELHAQQMSRCPIRLASRGTAGFLRTPPGHEPARLLLQDTKGRVPSYPIRLTHQSCTGGRKRCRTIG